MFKATACVRSPLDFCSYKDPRPASLSPSARRSGAFTLAAGPSAFDIRPEESINRMRLGRIPAGRINTNNLRSGYDVYARFCKTHEPVRRLFRQSTGPLNRTRSPADRLLSQRFPFHPVCPRFYYFQLACVFLRKGFSPRIVCHRSPIGAIRFLGVSCGCSADCRDRYPIRSLEKSCFVE